MSEVKTAPKQGKKQTAETIAAKAIAKQKAASKQGETPTVEPAKEQEQSNVTLLPVSIPCKDGAITKELFALNLDKLGKSIAEMLNRFPSTFVVRIFSTDIEVKKTGNFSERTFKFWVKVTDAIFNGMEDSDNLKEGAKLQFIKAMPFKFSAPCRASVMQSIKIRRDLAKVLTIVNRKETNVLNVSTIETTVILKDRVKHAEEVYKVKQSEFMLQLTANGETI